jgi:SAM-dependent methyltransferase
LTEVRLGDKAYRGQGFLVGYQTLELNGKLFRGQRECSERLKKVPYDFDGKVVVDLGCNCGGMLHALSKTIKKGYGFDVDPKCISAAQAINVLNHTANLEFFTFDLDRDELSLLPCFLLHEKADICFLLSVCIWLKKWRMVVKQAATLADVLLYEANGTAEQQEEQVNELRRYFNKISLISDESLDDPTHHERKLYLCIDSKR